MKKCARARPSYEAPSRRRYVKETCSGVYFKPKKKDTQNVVYELYGSGGRWGKVSAGQGDFNCMHERKVVCGRRDGRHADWLHATNGPIPTEPNPSDIFFFKKKKKESRVFCCSEIICWLVQFVVRCPFFSLARTCRFIHLRFTGTFFSWLTRRWNFPID